MPNTEDIFQLAQKAAVQVTASPDRWRRFLFTAAHNYRTTYLNQLLIHAQCPDATACAPMSYWNEQAHRKVMRGSKSILVLQRHEGRAVVNPLFSMTDTLLLGEKTAAPWEVTQENRKAVLQSLTDGDPRVFLIEQATRNAAEQFGRVRRVTERSVQGSALAWAKPEQQLAFMHDLAVQSAVYMAFLRLGLSVESASFPAFEQVAQLNTYPISLCLGGYLQTVAEPLLQEIGQAVLQQNRARDSVAKQAEPMHTISEPKENPDSRKEAARNDVHELQRISGAQPEPAEHARSQAEPLRQDAAGISRTERADPVRPHDAGGHAAAELPQDGAGRAANGGQDPARTDAENADAQPQDEPAGLDAAVQQPETAGGGSRLADAVRDLTESAPIAESEPSPSAFSLPEFPAELLPQLLKTESSSRAANADYLAFYQKSPLSIDRLRFVRDSYKDIFTELLLDGDTRVGFHRQEDGLLVWQGAYLTRSAETLLPWRAVANALNDLIGRHELTAALDVKALPQENTQLSFALPEDAPRGEEETLLADDELRSEEKQERAIPRAMENAPIRDDGSHITDEEVNLAVADGSGFEKGKLRIYRHFTEKRGDNAEFLKKEYGCGGRTWYYQNGGHGWVGHSPAGLTLTMTCADGRFERKLKWKETAQRITYLLEMQRYLTPEEEKEYPVWLAQQQEKQPPRAVVVPEIKPVCAEGSVVYLENGQPFTVENIGKFDVHLRDENFPLISRAVSREQLQPLLDAEPRNGGMVLPEVPPIDRDSDQMKQALSYIADYLRNEFDITDADFSDLTQIDLGYTTTEDEQHTIQVCADLERCTISKLVDNTLYAQETFASLKAMNRDLLSSLEFDSLMEVDSSEIEEREPAESPFVIEVMADVEHLSAAAEPAEYDLTNYLAPYEPTVPKGAKEKFAANAVTKTSGTRNGQVGPFTTQEAADAAANSARDSAIAELQGEAQNAVNNAIAAAKAQLGSIQFRYEEITVPYGFGKYWGTNGSSQTISVPANTNNDYVMKNDEWSLQVNLKKTDSETGNPIAADAQFEIYQWDSVSNKFLATGGYNTYSVQRQGDGSYAVINSAAYAVNDAMRHTLYYTQRNQGKFILVETKAPAGYFGDWTDIDHPGTAGTPLGKRAYYIEITQDNDSSVLWLDNADYNADILTADKGGTKLVTSGGVETTVMISNVYKNPTRIYSTDNSGKAANEDSYTTTATDGVMKNDRTLGEISISKVDLDAAKYVENHGNAALDGAVYDLYAAEDITHPDGVTGVVDYSKIVDADGNPIWHTTIRDNSGQWVSDYLPVLKKDHLVASAKIEDGWLTFANLYLGKYYVVERSTGTVIPLREGALAVSGTYPTVDSRTKAATGQVAALASSGGQYIDWVYKNQFSTITKGKALDGTVTYDAYSLSFANGYLCDEHNYYITPAYADEGWYVEKTTFAEDNAVYRANYHIHRDNALAESQDQIAKGNVEISKIISSSGESNGQELEGAGFTFYLVSDLSKAAQFTQSQTGAYSLQSILDCYLDKNYNNDHPKWDFSGEGQAVAKTYEVDAAEIAAYNKTLSAADDNKNGKGDGWQPTGTANEYRLAEIFSNDTGNIRVQGLPYGTYLVVETTVPKDLYQAEPYLVVIDRNSPMSAMATPKGSVLTASDSYQKFTVLDEQIEVYLRITKIDEETGKPVLLPGTAFQIYYLDDDGNYRLENGAPKLVRMTDTVNGHLTKNITTFYTNAEGVLTLPEKLPLGKYRIVETTAPNGFYNEWLDAESHYVDFTITTDRIYQATGDKNENGMDTLVIGEKYSNHETIGKLTIRKTGEVLTGWQSEPGGIDPWMTGEAESGNFVYETRPLAGAEYTITAAEDIYTQDRQLDNYGNRTLWYAKGDVVAVVITGDGAADTAVFAPARTAATYDFLGVIHDGTIGEVSVTLPLGSYHIEETKPPYGYVGTDAAFDVTLVWDNQTQEIVAADAVEFHNEREKAKVGICKTDLESGKYLAGAVFNLYTADDIYDADGSLVFAAGELVATSPETNADGTTYFDCDIPIRGEQYGSSTHKDATTNSGKYIVKEIRAPLGYYVNENPIEVAFTYDGEAVRVLESTCTDKLTEMWVSKRDLTNDEELPGATLTIKDADGNVVTSWVSTDTPYRVTGLYLGDAYTLTETRPADGYALADDITFRLLQKADEDGSNLQEAEVYYLTEKSLLFWTWDDWKLLDDATVIMRDDTIKAEFSKKDLTTMEELPGAELTITDKDGKELDRWVSTDKPHYIEKLPAGDYTLTEVKAPDGYAFAESVPFTVLPTGEVQQFEMQDDVIKVEISKKDLTTMEELPGAELTITDKDGKEIDRWVSSDKPHYIEKLPAGEYTLTEVKAPDGYTFAESVPFTVLPTGEVQRVVMKDAPIPEQPVQPTPPSTPTPTPLIPQTGDTFPLGLILALAGLSLTGLTALIYRCVHCKSAAKQDDESK